MLERVAPGSTIDGFVVGRHLHSGAMGNIFEVTKPGLTARMIMKVPRVGPNEPTEGIISFETEAAIVPVLSGPHVPLFIAAGDLTRTPYLVVEWIDGASLEEMLAAGRLPPLEAARVGAALADALHSMHEQEAIHFDVKPENVILKKDGAAALIDFGFAHHARFPDLLAEETRFGAGSSAYVSPEQIQGTREDPRSDIFSLGVVLYEVTTGKLPFEPDTDVRNRLWLVPVPPMAIVPEMPSWLQEIILRCLEPRADLRYQSAAHVAFDLRNPAQVLLTARARRLRRPGMMQHVRRFLRARREFGRRTPLPNAQGGRAPIIMVAVDTAHPDDERQGAIQRVAQQVLSLSEEFRVVCVSVVQSVPLIDGSAPSETASGIHLEHLVRLRHWVEPLRMPVQRISLHAIESESPAEALLEFARSNHVDLIILGAPGPTRPDRSWWRSVASTVTANAHCSVHVVRVPERRVKGEG
jgi:nucleotide-binding universal stress UspA family protein